MTDLLHQEAADALKSVLEFVNFNNVAFTDIANIVMREPTVLNKVIEYYTEHLTRGIKPTAILGIEARGFYLATIVAYFLGIPFIPLRKPGKMPGEVLTFTYKKEYGTDELCMQKGLIGHNDRVVIFDDVLATGGTLAAACTLTKKEGATVISCEVLVTMPMDQTKKANLEEVVVNSFINV